MNRSFVSRTDIYQDWIGLVMSAWDGPCEQDGDCVEEGCAYPDPDCDVCGFDGVCGAECPAPDLDCPLGNRNGESCDDAFDCEGRLCIEAPDSPGITYCSEACDPALAGEDCDAPLGDCIERGGQAACEYAGPTPGTQGTSCLEHDDCRAGVCDPADLICVVECGEGHPECPDEYECRSIGAFDACRLPEDGGCGCRAVGRGGLVGTLFLLAALAASIRRRRS
jgi:hypothetical protein